ncbi:MAG: TolC family protein [Gemmatimonadota bacterium]|jgi:outer membrane protein TolC
MGRRLILLTFALLPMGMGPTVGLSAQARGDPPDRWRAGTPLPGTVRTTTPLSDAWPAAARRTAQDTLLLTLEEAVDRALRDSEEIAAARASLAQAEAQVIQARSGAFPQLSSNVIYTRAIKTIFDEAQGPPPVSDTLIPPAFDLNKPPEERFDLLSDLLIDDFIGELFRGLPFGRKNTYIATFSLSQPLYVGGKVGAALNVARHFRAAAQDQMEEAEAEIVLQVRGAYLTASLAQRLYRIAVESRRVAEDHFQQVEDFYEAGTASQFDLLRAQVDLENRDPVVTQAENGATLALLELKRLVNISASRPLRLVTEVQPTLSQVNEAQLKRMILERPALSAAQEAVSMRQEAIKIARGDRLPTVALQGTMGFQGFPDNALPPGFDQWRKDWSVALTLSVPIFDGFRTRGQVDQAQADLKVAQLEESQLKEALELQLEAALAEYRSVRAQIEARRQTVLLAEETLELADTRFANGLSTQLEVSDAALLLDQARVNEVQALYDYVQVLAQLERLSGGRVDLMAGGTQ